MLHIPYPKKEKGIIINIKKVINLNLHDIRVGIFTYHNRFYFYFYFYIYKTNAEYKTNEIIPVDKRAFDLLALFLSFCDTIIATMPYINNDSAINDNIILEFILKLNKKKKIK
jgi:hypothetical protein